ncbi:hypothetical protein ACOI1H_24600, partial [Loktanella sp. DJP18]|uniref:hypothetical protein n=1 Tax=Loktanella sp. DJP18 TaxID=3409788 RepID=UPI003BB6CE74
MKTNRYCSGRGQHGGCGDAGRVAQPGVGHAVGQTVVGQVAVDVGEDLRLLERIVAAKDSGDQLLRLGHGTVAAVTVQALLHVLFAFDRAGLHGPLAQVDDSAMPGFDRSAQAQDLAVQPVAGHAALGGLVVHLGQRLCRFLRQVVFPGGQGGAGACGHVGDAGGQGVATARFAQALNQTGKCRLGRLQRRVAFADLLVDQIDGKGVAHAILDTDLAGGQQGC